MLLTAGIAAVVSALWFNGTPMDRILAGIFGAVAGGFVGTVGGLAASIPRRGVSLLTSISIVAASALVARFVTVYSIGFQKFGYPYLPAIAAAVLGGVVVFICGLVWSRARKQADSSALPPSAG